MEPLSIHILGCASANPLHRHRPASQVLSTRGKLFMVDCGEGTQTRLARQGLSLSRLSHIFLTHIHGDHCFGLPGLINTMGLLGRTATLHVHAPAQLGAFVEFIRRTFCPPSSFPLAFHAVAPTRHSLILDEKGLQVFSLPLSHGVPCCGYLFREKPSLPHIRRDVTDAYGIPVCRLPSIKAGADWTSPDGTLIPNARLTRPAEPPRSWAYVSDTLFLPSLPPLIEGVNLLFHEATFSGDNASLASATGHSTAAQAAMIAREAHARQLCIGHFSARLTSEEALLSEAQAVFPNTVLADEGLTIIIGSAHNTVSLPASHHRMC